MDQRISLVTLGVRDIGRAHAFYGSLGWSGQGKLAEDSVVTDGGGWGGVTLAYNVNSPEEVDRVMEEAKSAGATIGRAGAATFWGGYSGVFIDPDGHPWEVAHNPGWPIAPDGTIALG